jgi:hypothetical protein
MPIIPALERLRQEAPESKARLGYIHSETLSHGEKTIKRRNYEGLPSCYDSEKIREQLYMRR